jgi:hypothetical protein
MAKNKQIITNSPKKTVEIPTRWVAEVAQTSESLVRMVRNGKRNADEGAGSRVKVADMLLEEGVNSLLEEVKRVVKI